MFSKFAFNVGPLALALGVSLTDDFQVGAIVFDDYAGPLAAMFQSLMVSIGIVALICRHLLGIWGAIKGPSIWLSATLPGVRNTTLNSTSGSHEGRPRCDRLTLRRAQRPEQRRGTALNGVEGLSGQ